MKSESTKVGSRSSQEIQAIRLAPEPLLRPLKPEGAIVPQSVVLAVVDWAGGSDDAIEARRARHLISTMGVR